MPCANRLPCLKSLSAFRYRGTFLGGSAAVLRSRSSRSGRFCKLDASAATADPPEDGEVDVLAALTNVVEAAAAFHFDLSPDMTEPHPHAI